MGAKQLHGLYLIIIYQLPYIVMMTDDDELTTCEEMEDDIDLVTQNLTIVMDIAKAPLAHI